MFHPLQNLTHEAYRVEIWSELAAPEEIFQENYSDHVGISRTSSVHRNSIQVPSDRRASLGMGNIPSGPQLARSDTKSTQRTSSSRQSHSITGTSSLDTSSSGDGGNSYGGDNSGQNMNIRQSLTSQQSAPAAYPAKRRIVVYCYTGGSDQKYGADTIFSIRCTYTPPLPSKSYYIRLIIYLFLIRIQVLWLTK